MSNTGNDSQPSAYNTGIAATETKLATSASTLRGLAPNLSTSAPPTKNAMTMGMAVNTSTSDVDSALCVVCSTNHGIATRAIWFPSCEIALAVRIDQKGRRRLFTVCTRGLQRVGR